jgi:O-antigen/teichoic acid export membrane protein
VDMIVVGWLFTSDQAADYAIASRIAALLPFFQQILMKSFMVKAGQALNNDDSAALQAATFANVRSTIMLVGLTTVAALIVYPAFAHFVGDFGSSLPLMAALAVAPMMRSYFSANDPLMRIAGMTNTSLTIMLLSCSFVILFPMALHGLIGTFALPLGMFASAVFLNPWGSRYLRRVLHVRMMPAGLAWTMGLCFLTLLLCILSKGQLILWYLGIAGLLGTLAFVNHVNRRKGS